MAAASQPRAWEARERQWHQRSFAEDRWESEPEGEEYDYNTMSTREAAGLLFDTIVDAKVGGKISAKVACLLAFYAVKAGVGDSEELAKLGLDTTKQSGKYSQRFDSVVGHPKADGYQCVKVATDRSIAPSIHRSIIR